MIEVDKGLCIGCGNCVSACSDCFQLDENGKSEVKKDCEEGCCDLGEIADNCPANAITLKK